FIVGGMDVSNKKMQKAEQVEAVLETEHNDEVDQEQPKQHEEVEKIKVSFIANTKHNDTCYTYGQKAEVTAEDYGVLLAAKVIQPPEE
ncbi:hypothetical protein, partial [Paenibacillus dendritiformis]|uniref:hypothetical protein n=1 Tax=Paenibacillus dendritiformis TaxID=130049 RepID=UPI001C65EB0B